MVKIFKQQDQITLVLPNTKDIDDKIESILRSLYGDELPEVKSVEVKGILPLKNPPTPDGVQVITTEEKKKIIIKDIILDDSRNPFPGLKPIDAYRQNGIEAVIKYQKMGLIKGNEKDEQIKLEFYHALKMFLLEKYNIEYIEKADLSEIKNVILVISKKLYNTTTNRILKSVAMNSVEAFIADSSESMIRSACAKIVQDFVKRLSE